MLQPLTPIGVGTAAGESLSSYVQRLAVAHGTLPGQLVFRLLTWLDLGQPEKIGHWQREPRRVRIGKNNNSFTHADVWLRLLQRVTSRSDLIHLTTRGWDHLFPALGFQRANLAWCPLCLAGDLIPYHRLSWMIQPVRICSVHRCLLRHVCLKCRNSVPVIHNRSAVTMCPWCASDLRDGNESGPRDGISQYDHWAAQEIGMILEASTEWHRPLHWEPAVAVRRLAIARGLEDAAAFGRFIGTSKITAWYWFTSKARPSLPMTLHMYHCSGASIATELSGRKPNREPSTDVQPEMHLRQLRNPQRRNWPKIEKQLLAELKRPPEKSKPLAVLGRQLEIHIRTLRAHFPKLCQKIAKRHQRWCHDEAVRRRLLLRKKIEEAITRLRQTGTEVNTRSVSEMLSHPGLFSRPIARHIYRQLILALPRCS